MGTRALLEREPWPFAETQILARRQTLKSTACKQGNLEFISLLSAILFSSKFDVFIMRLKFRNRRVWRKFKSHWRFCLFRTGLKGGFE